MLEKVLKSALGNAEDRRAPNVGEPGGDRRPGRRRPDVQADAAAGPRHGVHDQEADGAHSRVGRHALTNGSTRYSSKAIGFMGQKVNPTGFRTGIMVGWKSRWYASKQEFCDLLIEDLKIRKFVKEKYKFRRHSQDRDRADARRSEGHPARRPAGRHHRPQGASKSSSCRTSCRTWSAGGSTSRSRKSPGRRFRPSWWPRTSPSSWPSGPASAAR